MIIDEKRFPILEYIVNNKLTNNVFQMFYNSGFDEIEVMDIKTSFDFFANSHLQINYITTAIHDKLIDTSNFINAKILLKNSEEITGLLLLPKIIHPDFKNVPDYIDVNANDYPIDAILYSWRSVDNHAKISGDFNEEDPWGNEKERTLLIIPFCDDRITQAANQYELTSNDEIYGWEYSAQEGRSWYGKIHDYVMSFLLLYNFTYSEMNINNDVDTVKSRQLRFDDEKFVTKTKNNIEIIDINYLTDHSR